MSALALTVMLSLVDASLISSPTVSVESEIDAASEPALDTVNGLYPLWEQTAVLHPKGTIEIGYQHAQVGFGAIQVGTSPYLDLFGTYNLNVKVKVFRGASTDMAFTVASYRVPTQAESRSIGNLHAIGLSNPYAPIWVLPTSVALRQILSPRIHLHTNTTVLLTYGADGKPGSAVSWGQVSVAEFRAGPSFRTFLHAGIEGLGVTSQAHLGLSFGHRGRFTIARAGYTRRFSFDGESDHVFLFDGGLILP